MKTITGSWQNPNGTPAKGATLRLQLSQNATVIGTSQIADPIVYVPLDNTGSIPSGTQVWGTDELSPAGLYYITTVVQPGFGTIYGPENFPIAGTSPVDLTQIIPLFASYGTVCAVR